MKLICNRHENLWGPHTNKYTNAWGAGQVFSGLGARVLERYLVWTTYHINFSQTYFVWNWFSVDTTE
jgi:hypothetical protein